MKSLSSEDMLFYMFDGDFISAHEAIWETERERGAADLSTYPLEFHFFRSCIGETAFFFVNVYIKTL